VTVQEPFIMVSAEGLQQLKELEREYSRAVTVEAADLETETQKSINRTPGLHRDVARQLVLDRNPDLAAEHDSDEALQQQQEQIKSGIADIRGHLQRGLQISSGARI
jgi:hypothetical protein